MMIIILIILSISFFYIVFIIHSIENRLEKIESYQNTIKIDSIRKINKQIIDHHHHQYNRKQMIYGIDGILYENLTEINLNSIRLSQFREFEGNQSRDLTFNSSIINENKMTGIMYYPSECVSTFDENNNLMKYLSECKENLLDTCNVVKKYLINDPKWIQRGPNSIDKRNFIEVGGLDGSVHNTMTAVIEKYMYELWVGLTIEATPANFARLIENRPCLYRTEIALGPSWGKTNFIGWGGCCSGTAKSMSKNFVDLFHGSNPRSYKVTTAPLTDVIKAASMKKIDYLSLDVEGAEFFVLDGLDLSITPVSMILIEFLQKDGVVSNDDVTKKLITLGFIRDMNFQSYNNLNQLWIHEIHAEKWIIDILKK